MQVELFYQGILLVLLVLVLLNLANNLRSFRRLSSYTLPDPLRRPMISVLVPARNEERSIARCLESLLAQDYPYYEVVVLDDHSSDRTPQILADLQRQDPRLRVLQGAALPPGWVGKSYACHQLGKEARGEYLLFVDADTWHRADTLSHGLAAMLEGKVDLLSVIPKEQVISLSERMIVPFMHFAILCFLPLPLISGSPNPLFAFSVGQFMFFRLAAYRAIGGHASVPGELVEDVELGKRIKRRGFRLRLADGKGLVFCRMYWSLAEVWRGFAKSFFSAFHFQLLPMGAVIIVVDLLFLGPFIALLLRAVQGTPWDLIGWLVLLQILLIAVIRILLAWRFSYEWLDVFLHPAAMLHINLIAFFSMGLHYLGRGFLWKGRRYRSSEPVVEEETLEPSLAPQRERSDKDRG